MVCSFCFSCLAENVGSHHPSLNDLISSSQSCIMCRILVESLSKEDMATLMSKVSSGSYSKIRVSVETSFVSMDIYTKDRCIRGENILIRKSPGKF